MSAPKVLIASTHIWDGPLQVGTHHLGRCFIQDGWDVAFISAPLCPLHTVMRSRVLMYEQRMANYRSRGTFHESGRLWSYVPWSLLTADVRPILNTPWLAKNWYKFSYPNIVDIVRERGFGQVDLIIFDNVFQMFWLDKLDYSRAVYRMRDDNSAVRGFGLGLQRVEEELCGRVDKVFYTSLALRNKISQKGGGGNCHLPNGVEYELFSKEQPAPKFYEDISGIKCVYAGTFDWRFDFRLMKELALKYKEISFILIGPRTMKLRELDKFANVYLVGSVDYDVLPTYLQHADVALIPFKTHKLDRIANVSPLKAYQYMAAGLPIVSMDWEALPDGAPYFYRCKSTDEFIKSIQKAASSKIQRDVIKIYARRYEWKAVYSRLIEKINV